MTTVSYVEPPSVPQRLAVLENAGYFLLREFATKQDSLALVRRVLFEEIEAIAGRSVRDAVVRDGLGRIHKHFRIEDVPALRRNALTRLRGDLLRLSSAIGRDDLKMPSPFFVDDYMFLRISYPHEVAARAKGPTEMSASGESAKSLAAYAHRDPLWKRVARPVYRRARKLIDRPRPQPVAVVADPYDLNAYNRGLPKATWIHGPHRDTWYGHSLDGINLWWAIEGVTPENLMVFYPGMFGTDIDFDPQSRYLAAGFPISEPVKFRVQDGDMLVFNPEIPHASHLNISDMTRVAFTTRINSTLPKFDERLENKISSTWHRSTEIDQGDVDSLHQFRKEDCTFTKPQYTRARRREDVAKSIQCDVALPADGSVPVCQASEIPDNGRLAIKLSNAHVLVMRTDQGVRAVSATCPHIGIALIDGFVDGADLTCPGHGVTFNLETGGSGCASMRLRTFEAKIVDGQLYLGWRS